MSRPPRDGYTFNGVQLGLGSPIINLPKRRRYVGPDEFTIQRHLIDALRGEISKATGERPAGGGLTGRYPELNTLYAVPNGGHRLKAAAGKAKAEGQLRSVSDLVLPAPRYPFHGLYLEVKTPAGYLRDDQRQFLELMLERGFYGAWIQGTQEGVDLVSRYLDLPRWPEPPQLLELRRLRIQQLTLHPVSRSSNG